MSTLTRPFKPTRSDPGASDAHVARALEAGALRPPRRADAWALARLGTDGAALALATVVAATSIGRSGGQLGWLVAVPVLVFATLALVDLSAQRLRALAWDEAQRVVKVCSVATMAVALVALVAGAGAERVQDVIEQGLIAAGLLAASRVVLAGTQSASRRRHGPSRRTLIIGAGRVGRLTAARLVAEPTLGLLPIGFLDKEPMAGEEDSPELPVFGASWDLERTIEDESIETVVVAFSSAPNHVPLAIVRRCWELSVPVILIPRLFEVQGVRTVSEHIGGLPLLTLNPANPRGWQLRARYAVDRVLASLAVLALSPLLIAFTLAVLLTMGRPIFFRQSRMGRDGHGFDMLKFRTMWGGAAQSGEHDARWAESAMGTNGDAGGNGAQPGGTPQVDRRTPLGAFMRRWSVDELPQLVNVVRGEMALIGPRPERVRYANEFEKAVYRYRDRARIKPGITGWAQVHGLRGQTSLADRVEWDNFYIENWSPWLDVKILLRTLAYALRHGD